MLAQHAVGAGAPADPGAARGARRSTPRSRPSTTCASTSRTPSPRPTWARRSRSPRSTRAWPPSRPRPATSRPAAARRTQGQARRAAGRAGPEDDVAPGDTTMKLTPFAKLFITVVILGVLGYAAWHYKGAEIRKWAGAEKSAAKEEVTANDFDALRNAPPDPDRNEGSPGVTSTVLASGGKLARPLVVGINTWAGHSPGIVFNDGLDPEPGLALQAALRPRREVRAARGPGGQARRLPQRRHRHHVGHGRQLGARGLDPRRAGAARPSRSSCRTGRAAATASSRSPRSTRSRTCKRQEDRLHAVHALALPAALPARRSPACRPRTAQQSRRTSSSRRTRRPPPRCSRRGRSTRR